MLIFKVDFYFLVTNLSRTTCPQLDPFLSYLNSAHTLITYFINVVTWAYINAHSVPWHPNWSFPVGFYRELSVLITERI